jgi:glycosyltransferase involved in cell wall biosynthesis
MKAGMRTTRKSRGIVVLGMPRSGLSTVAGVLEGCGVWFGREDEGLGHQNGAPEGGFERPDLQSLCEEFLKFAHSSWWHLSEFDPEAIPHAVRHDLDGRFSELVQALSGHGAWGLKEPTLSLLFPILEQYIPDAVCVIPIRNPVEIAKSLRSKNGVSISHGIALWELYMRHALAASQKHARVLISYSDLIAAPEETTKRLIQDLQEAGVTELADPENIGGIISPDLHRHTAKNSELCALLSPTQMDLWASILDQINLAMESEQSVSEGALIQLQDLEQQYDAQLKIAKDLEHSETRVEELQAQVGEMQNQVDRHRYGLEQLQRELDAARQDPLKALRRKIMARILYVCVKQKWLFSERQRTRFLRSAQKRNPKPIDLANKTAINDAVAASKVSSNAAPMSCEEAKRVLSEEMPFFEPGRQPMRLLPRFDTEYAQRYVAAAIALYDETCAALKVTVVMPTFNRGPQIAAAVQSVLDQSHQNLELLVVDDGSTDDTQFQLAQFSHDQRLRIFLEGHLGVSEARNTALKHASGDYVFYLDSDNTWTPDYVKLMLAGLSTTKADCAYSASCAVNETGKLVGFRGEPFDWNACHSANYVDMNVFAHRRDLFEQYGGFDPDLRRVVDWDLILRYTKAKVVRFFPFIGCMYLDNASDTKRVSLSEPNLFKRIVRVKNQLGLKSGAEALDRLQLSFAIKIAAPYKTRAEWGDFHYAESLSNALERLGHSVRIDFYGEWGKPEARSDDVVLVLRGLTGYTPQPNQLTLMWNISHPDQISYEEYAACHRVFVASRSYAALLSMILEKPIYPLLQCTDTDRFHLPVNASPIDPEARGVFIGNSHNEFRPMVRWSVEHDVRIDIYGTGWGQFIPKGLILGENVPNPELAEKYRSARFVLNDHWHAMKDFGFVSNRVFDVIGCGGKLVSDSLPALETLFGDVVETVHDEAEFMKAVSKPPPTQERRRDASDYVQRHHSFNVRAKALCNAVQSVMTTRPREVDNEPNFATNDQRRRVGLLLQRGRASWTSSAYIRLIAPLTTDYAYEVAGLDLIALDGVEDPRLDSCDVCIVQRVGVPDAKSAQRLIEKLSQKDIPLYVDTDDAFFLHDAYRKSDKSLRLLMEAAREVWFSTPNLAKLYNEVAGGKSRIRINNLDPRFWRDYRNPINTTFSEGPIRFVYMGTATHHEDLKMVMPAFERLARDYPGRFELTLVGITSTPPQADWLKICNPPQDAGGYPAFARFVTREIEFDVGIAPLVASPFNAAKSDIKFLDYSAMGLLSVVTDGPTYRDCIDEGLAVGCNATEEAWYGALARIIESRFDFAEMRDRATRHVWEARNVLKDPAPLADLLTRDRKL